MAKKNYVAIVRDHSGSMQSLKRKAAQDYNANVRALQEAARAEKQDTIVSTVKCGIGSAGSVVRDVVNSNVRVLKEIAGADYETSGASTPLFDSVAEAIDILQRVPDADDPDVSFLVMVITDGQENSSRMSGVQLGRKIRDLQSTDRWTFAFRVPHGEARHLVSLGIPDGNILEWEQSERGFEVATRSTVSAISSYYQARTSGQKSVRTFYTDLKGVDSRDLKVACEDISKKVDVWKTGKDTELVREFCERRSKRSFLKGAAFYELVKTEPKVQDYKMIAIRDRQTGAIYAGAAARQMLGLPPRGTARVVPGDHSKYDVFIQSTSVNRKLTPFTSVLYYPDVGEPYIEGVSAPYAKR